MEHDVGQIFARIVSGVKMHRALGGGVDNLSGSPVN